jgi:hypothetical protein
VRFVTLAALLLALLYHQSFACGEPHLTEAEQLPKTFVYDKGWTIPGLADATITRTHRDDSGSEEIIYKPKKTVMVELQGFGMSGDGRSLRLVPGYVQLVLSISEYRVQNRTYAYDVITVSTGKADPPMWPRVRESVQRAPRGQNAGVLGCGFTVLRYFDRDGDGRFESLEYVGFGAPDTNSTRCSTTPDWALMLLPNRAAAESCAKQLQPPAILIDILSLKPAMPTLLPTTEK